MSIGGVAIDDQDRAEHIFLVTAMLGGKAKKGTRGVRTTFCYRDILRALTHMRLLVITSQLA